MVKLAIFALVFLLCGIIIQGKADGFLKGKFLPVNDVPEDSSLDLPSFWESFFEDHSMFKSFRIQHQVSNSNRYRNSTRP